MAADFEIRGADEVARLSRALKDAGRGQMRKELNASLRKSASPLIGATRAAAQQRLPQAGGLADRVVSTPQRIQVRKAGVRIAAGNSGSGARAANKGRLRHPVFGNRRVWVTQKVRPGWFDDPIRARVPAIRGDLEHAVEHVLDRIIREAR